MSFVVAFTRTLAASPAACFAALASFPAWRSFMPSSFRPLRGPERPFRLGDRMLVLVAGSPMVLRISRLEADRVIAWRGGIPGVLAAEHVFFFDAAREGATEVRSEETWSGVLAGLAPVEQRIRVAAARVGGQQVDGLTRWCEGESSRRRS